MFCNEMLRDREIENRIPFLHEGIKDVMTLCQIRNRLELTEKTSAANLIAFEICAIILGPPS